MGCDIHPFLEAKFGGKWMCLGSLISHRNYGLFGKLSGVRREEEKQFFDLVSKLPSGVSKEIRDEFDDWGSDAHSLTVCSHEDLQRFCSMHRPTLSKKEFEEMSKARSNKKLLDKILDADEMKWQKWWGSAGYCVEWLEMMGKLIEAGAEDARVILWYDN